MVGDSVLRRAHRRVCGKHVETRRKRVAQALANGNGVVRGKHRAALGTIEWTAVRTQA